MLGFETTSTVLTFAVHLLANHKDIQDRARKVVKETLQRHNNEWTYDAIMEMKYLEQIVEETLRLEILISNFLSFDD